MRCMRCMRRCHAHPLIRSPARLLVCCCPPLAGTPFCALHLFTPLRKATRRQEGWWIWNAVADVEGTWWARSWPTGTKTKHKQELELHCKTKQDQQTTPNHPSPSPLLSSAPQFNLSKPSSSRNLQATPSTINPRQLHIFPYMVLHCAPSIASHRIASHVTK